MTDWDQVAGHALTLPDTVAGTTYRKPAVKLNGRMLIAATAPDPGSFVVHAALDDKAVLIDTDPDTFWETDHYRGWPAVLVRFDSVDPERVRTVIARAWWDRATRRQRDAFGPRP